MKKVALMSQPLGFLRCLLKISAYRSMFPMLMASSKVRVTIWGTRVHLSFSGHKSPGTSVPSSEQKQSGNLHSSLSQGGALLGSVSASQTFSSDPSVQSVSPLQKRFFSIQVPSPQASSLGLLHSGVSVTSRGFTFLSLVSS